MSDNRLDSLSRRIRQTGPAPVHLWNPPFCGDIDIRIDRSGRWYYQGSEIRRRPLVKLFASVLKRENDEFFLVTPIEKLRIQVEDCPFVAVLLDIAGEGRQRSLVFTTNLDESVTLDKAHPLSVGQDITSGEPHPVLAVRGGLNALVNRNVFYQLADIAQPQSPDSSETHRILGVWSQGHFFTLGEV